MAKRFRIMLQRLHVALFLSFLLWTAGSSALGQESLKPGTGIDTKSIPFKIVYESLREANGTKNWELIMINADGSNPVNLTKTPNVSEIYPHASPDGTKVCFEGEEGTGREKVRSVYCMNIDGTDRVKVAHNARQACWSPDGRTIAFLKAEFDRYTIQDYATKGVYFYDLKSGKTTEHPNCAKLYHLYNLCWSPDGKWFAATVHGGMGFDHADLAFPADGNDVFDLYAVPRHRVPPGFQLRRQDDLVGSDGLGPVRRLNRLQFRQAAGDQRADHRQVRQRTRSVP